MKRFLLILMILALTVTLLAGCKNSTADGEEDAVIDTEYNAGNDGGEGTSDQDREENPKEDAEPPKDDPQQKPEGDQPNAEKPEGDQPNAEKPEGDQPDAEKPEGDQPDAEKPEGDQPDAEMPEEEQPGISEEVDPYADYIKVASYNVKRLMDSKDKDGIVAELKEIDADIVGLQEIDSFTTRSGAYDQMEFLAKECGYTYYSFDKLIDHQGGSYGMGVLSRYPIKSSEVVQYAAQCSEDHVRKYGRHVLDIDGKEVVFYNTHLAIRDGEDEVSVPQLKEVTDRMAKDRYAVLTGDLNMKAPTAAKAINKSKLIILNDGGPNTTYIGSKKASDFIDHIITTKTLKSYWNEESGTGVEVNVTPYSDHNLVYTYVDFK